MQTETETALSHHKLLLAYSHFDAAVLRQSDLSHEAPSSTARNTQSSPTISQLILLCSLLRTHSSLATFFRMLPKINCPVSYPSTKATLAPKNYTAKMPTTGVPPSEAILYLSIDSISLEKIKRCTTSSRVPQHPRAPQCRSVPHQHKL